MTEIKKDVYEVQPKEEKDRLLVQINSSSNLASADLLMVDSEEDSEHLMKELSVAEGRNMSVQQKVKSLIA